jgi:hypothetical protein
MKSGKDTREGEENGRERERERGLTHHLIKNVITSIWAVYLFMVA